MTALSWAVVNPAKFYSDSQCLVTKTKQLASTEQAVSVSMEYSLESVTDVLTIYKILKNIDIREHNILNRTFFSVKNPLLAEVFLGLQEPNYTTIYSLDSGKLDFFLQAG